MYALVPCLNEEPVIGETVRRLVADRRVTVVVVDDGSIDDTGDVARAAAAGAAGRLHVVRRELPDARRGKGEALNAGFAMVERLVEADGLAADQVLVCVMDADGRLSDRALDAVLPLFADPTVGGVQLSVHIRNRTMLIGRMQDVEMAGVSSVAQFGRMALGTVSLGGNGQFTRLTALRGLGPRPWTRCLTEDLDLTARLATAGWRLTSTTRAYVDQQGVESWRQLLRQRSRWAQGHMSCIAQLPRIWWAPQVSHLGAIELMLYLLLPWTQLLWSGLFLLAVAGHGLDALTGAALGLRLDELPMLAASLVGWYTLSFVPNWIGAYLYRLRRPGTGPLRALTSGHLLLLAALLGSLAIWRGFLGLVTGRNTWVKTTRVAEPAPAG